MSYAPPLLVDPIPRMPVPFGLRSVVPIREAVDLENGHWRNGVTWESLGCAPASGLGEAQCVSTTQALGLPFNFPAGVPVDVAHPFTIYATHKCSALGHDDPFGYAAMRAEEKLMAREIQRVEQALWSGDLYDPAKGLGNPGFTYNANVLAGGAAVSLRIGIGMLDSAITASYGSMGVIHMTRTAATAGRAIGGLDNFEQVLKDFTYDGKLRTQMGVPVVAGTGYSGAGPSGVAGTPGVVPGVGKTWIYATPAMDGWRGDVLTLTPPAQSLEQTNDLEAVSQRTYVVRWDSDCPTFAVQVDMTLL